MRIGLVFPGFSANEHDWCIPAFLDFVRTLASRHDVRVLTLRYPHFRAQYDVFGARVTSLDGRERRGFAALRLRAKALNWIRREHRTKPFDVLHAFFADEAGLLAALAGKILRVPTLVSLAGGELVALRDIGYGGQLSFTSRIANRIALSLAARITVGSRVHQNIARGFVDDARLEFAPLGVDTQMFSPAPREPHADFVLLNVATLVPVKNQMRLLKIFRAVHEQEPHARLQIVGAGVLERALRARARELRIDARVEFLGAREHHDLVEIYRGADLFVLTSYHEAEGMVVLEAAACGLPTVATRVGVLAEFAPNAARTGETDEEISGAILGLMRDADSLEKMRAKTRAFVVENYSLDVCLARWEKIYAQVLSNPPA